MDFNQLYFTHQVLLMKAERAPSESRRHSLEMAASHVAGRIGCMQGALGASAGRVWDELAVFGENSLAPPTRHLQGYVS